MHDLVRVDASAIYAGGDTPQWMATRSERSRWAVVRREFVAGSIAIGFRGATRAERFAATISPTDVIERITPWQLSIRHNKNERLCRAYVAATDAAALFGLRIAPVGSFGFELGSREQVTHATSDLDLIIDAAGVDRKQLASFRSAIDNVTFESSVQIDAELTFERGGVALREALSGVPVVLFKTSAGPMLLPCPI